ncbi:MAG: hypothetical protein GY715_19805 [Planctomycetes bacterium]|nr:hypothetical protein [Planctomycetota bacterium]
MGLPIRLSIVAIAGAIALAIVPEVAVIPLAAGVVVFGAGGVAAAAFALRKPAAQAPRVRRAAARAAVVIGALALVATSFMVALRTYDQVAFPRGQISGARTAVLVAVAVLGAGIVTLLGVVGPRAPRSPIGRLTGAIGLLMLIVPAALLTIDAGRVGHRWTEARTNANRLMAQTRLKSVYQAAAIFARKTESPLPGAAEQLLSRLLEAQYINRELLEDWPAPTPGDPLFFYVPGYAEGLDALTRSDRIALYENPVNHAGHGGSVVYADARTEWLNAADLERAIAGITLPDGTPWTPPGSATR